MQEVISDATRLRFHNRNICNYLLGRESFKIGVHIDIEKNICRFFGVSAVYRYIMGCVRSE